MEALANLRANLNSARASAPAYAHDPAAYADMQRTQLDCFPVDVSECSRLHLWQCQEDCEGEE